MDIGAFMEGVSYFGDLGVWLSIFAGVVVGLIIGLIPGLNTLVGLALILPFVFILPPEQALPMMVALFAASITGGSITAILVNIPGQDTSAPTLIDGFPLTKKGEAGRALGAALTASGTSGITTAVWALLMIPLVLPMVMALRLGDMVFIILLGLTFIAVLGRGSQIKGLISGGLGLVISLIGFQITTGVPRFTFGNIYLYEGIDLIALAMGLFALPAAISLIVRGGAIAEVDAKIVNVRQTRALLQGAKDVFHHWGLWLRSNLIGYIVGLAPGVGATAATFVAYGQAKLSSKHPETFGSGAIEGVIAPEAANNASQAGSMLTTLALGIPGSAGSALLLAALLMIGIIPGPQMLTTHLALTISMLLTIIIGNVLAVVIAASLVNNLVKLSFVPNRIIVPVILFVALLGAYAGEQQFGDVVTAVVFTGLGLAIQRFGYSAPALFLGFILGTLFEKYLFMSLSSGGPLFFLRPISLTLIVIIIAIIFMTPIKKTIGYIFRRGVKAA